MTKIIISDLDYLEQFKDESNAAIVGGDYDVGTSAYTTTYAEDGIATSSSGSQVYGDTTLTYTYSSTSVSKTQSYRGSLEKHVSESSADAYSLAVGSNDNDSSYSVSSSTSQYSSRTYQISAG